MRREYVMFGEHKIPYLYGVDCTAEIIGAIVAQFADAPSAVLVVDERVARHAEPVVAGLAARLPVHRYVIDAAERHKRLSLVEELLAFAVERGADRASLLIAMGGGLAGNVAGLAAALLYRGIRLIHLPTTPVAAFDAVLSQKQAVNLAAGKNLCGTYFRPSLIACDLRWLTTMTPRDLMSGVAEMAKNVIAVAPYQEERFTAAVSLLGSRPVDGLAAFAELGIEAKVPVLARDPRERREALIFEYGHTVGHALEIVTDGRIGHGEAIAWGSLVAARVSATLGLLDAAGLEHQHRVLARLRLPPPTELAAADRFRIRDVLARDNKRGYLDHGPDHVPMVLLSGPGRPVTRADGLPLTAVPESVVLAAFDTVVSGTTAGGTHEYR